MSFLLRESPSLECPSIGPTSFTHTNAHSHCISSHCFLTHVASNLLHVPVANKHKRGNPTTRGFTIMHLAWCPTTLLSNALLMLLNPVSSSPTTISSPATHL